MSKDKAVSYRYILIYFLVNAGGKKNFTLFFSFFKYKTECPLQIIPQFHDSTSFLSPWIPEGMLHSAVADNQMFADADPPLIPTEQTLHNYKQCQTHSYPALSAPQSHRERHSLADSLETDSVCTQISHLRRGLLSLTQACLHRTPRQSRPDMTGSIDTQPCWDKGGERLWHWIWPMKVLLIFFFLSLLKAQPGSVCWSEHSCVKKMYWYFLPQKKKRKTDHKSKINYLHLCKVSEVMATDECRQRYSTVNRQN